MGKTLLLLAAVALAFGQAHRADAAYTIPRDVFGTGGGLTSGESYQVHGTLGQAAIGLMDGTANRHMAGFWYVVHGIVVMIEGMETPAPATYSLGQNFPNPFNPRTSIAFGIRDAGQVTLRIFDITGREVATIVNAHMPPGTYSLGVDADQLASGVYFYRLKAGEFSKTRKMLLLK